MTDSYTTDIAIEDLGGVGVPAEEEACWALTIVWSADAPQRVGETCLLPERGVPRSLGRGGESPDDATPRAIFVRPRPGQPAVMPPLGGRGLSRRQLELHASRTGVRIINKGRSPLWRLDQQVQEVTLKEGETVHIDRQLVLLLTRRASRAPAPLSFELSDAPNFGQADNFGVVGESEACWRLRDSLAFIAKRQVHVLISGESGTGKELAARAIHDMSPRGARNWVSRNAATLPAGLIDAELFGNIRDYPNPGMRARPGIVGEADNGTLFLDEIGELPVELQAHLLRVLDSGGEYHSLGDSRPRTSNFRLIAATNRNLDELKHDLVARLPMKLSLKGLNERREDIPLLVHHLLRAIAADDSTIAERYFYSHEGTLFPRVTPHLMAELVEANYSLHTRQLQALLWQSLATSPGSALELTAEVRAGLPAATAEFREPGVLTREEIVAALEAVDGHRKKAAAALGLKNRDVLYRLLKKHGLE